MKLWNQLKHLINQPVPPDRSAVLHQLSNDDDSVLSPSLRSLYRALRRLGFDVLDVHIHSGTEVGFELLLDHEIDAAIVSQLAIPNDVECYEDNGPSRQFRGYGFLCLQTGQCINGPCPSV